MSSKGLQRLAALAKLNGDPAWINRDVYRLMYKDDLYISAYERIKSKPGNMTPGVDGSTLDGFSLREIEKIITAMRDESFQFSPGRRTYIPKRNGKTRPLTIAPPREKVVQEVMRMILEAIYDSHHGATFLDCSHGFRSGRGTHTALKEIRSWKNVSWFIEGDIKGCFDNIDHGTLILFLRRRIQDERFLNLIWKALKAGYMEFQEPRQRTLAGTPQGSIVSPILANIYLHELDLFARQLCEEQNKGSKRRINPEYKRLAARKAYYKRKGDSVKVAELARVMRSIPSSDLHDPDFARVYYVRYADDWIVGITGSKTLASEMRDSFKAFLAETLKLDLSIEKSHIRHARTEPAFFLGTYLGTQGTKEQKVSLVKQAGHTFRRRGTGWNMVMKAPVAKIISSLADERFCDQAGTPRAKNAWLNYDPHDILLRYNATLRGILNYYSFADNYSALSRVEYILLQSAAKLFASKFRLGSRRKVFARYGPNLRISTEDFGKLRTSEFLRVKSWRRSPGRFMDGDDQDPPLVQYWTKYTRSRLFLSCLICDGQEGVEMHHIRHVRKAGTKLHGFSKQMSLINRKQIPVCHQCHTRVHRGEYDGISLPELARARGFR